MTRGRAGLVAGVVAVLGTTSIATAVEAWPAFGAGVFCGAALVLLIAAIWQDVKA